MCACVRVCVHERESEHQNIGRIRRCTVKYTKKCRGVILYAYLQKDYCNLKAKYSDVETGKCHTNHVQCN